jgi:hypothetical protein
MKLFGSVILGTLLMGVSAFASTSFPQCPAVGNDSNGCEFLITVTSASGGIGTNFTVIPSVPDQGPYDGSDDTLVGVLNSTNSVINSLSITSNTDIFGFDGDGACSGLYGTISGCAGATDTSGYAPAGVTFSNIDPSFMSGTVNFSPGLAPGGSQWFSLEEALQPNQIMPASAPEPSSMILLGAGLGALGLSIRQRRAALKR